MPTVKRRSTGAADQAFMATAIALSERARGHSGPNPNVGCLIVKQDRIVGRGWTQATGRPHAEAMALDQAGTSARGATVYVSLEPCAHDSERGPACTDLLITAGVKRVVVATLDADERTRRRGIDRLGEAGIAVSIGMLERRARRTMAGFLTRHEKGRPFVTLKLALSLDGAIALADGRSQWITGERARAHAHLERARSDAILVGAGTVRADTPGLDCRLPGLESRSPQPLVLGEADMPDHWQRISKPDEITTLDGINWLLVEGGAQTAASFLRAGVVDRLLLYRAPIVIGGGKAGVGDIGLDNLAHAHDRWRRTDSRQLGPDMLEIYDAAA